MLAQAQFCSRGFSCVFSEGVKKKQHKLKTNAPSGKN
jgi:hypothetical protein